MRWYILLLIIFLAAVVLEAGLMVFALYVVLGVYFLSRYLAKNWIASLTAKRETSVSEALEIGESIEVKVVLRNKGTWIIGWLLAEDILPESSLKVRPPKLTIRGKRIRLGMIRPGKTLPLKYTIVFQFRGYYQIGPTILETGDFFGLHRRHRVITRPSYVMVYPKVIPLPKYDFASQRPIGEVSLANRLFEDPTRNAGVRPYQIGDPLQRVHWRATARTGTLQSRVFDPTSLAGASLVLDFHQSCFPSRGEPYRSELVITTAASVAYLVATLNQQLGLYTNGQDAANRLRLNIQIQLGGDDEVQGFETRENARASSEVFEENHQMKPIMVETRRGIEQFQRIREALARLEISDGLSFPQLILESTPRMPRDATIIAILPAVSVETASVLGTLRRQGFAVSAILIALEDEDYAVGYGRLLVEGIRDVRHVASEEGLMNLGEKAAVIGDTTPLDIDRVLA